jgi:hypothetical protein
LLLTKSLNPLSNLPNSIIDIDLGSRHAKMEPRPDAAINLGGCDLAAAHRDFDKLRMAMRSRLTASSVKISMARDWVAYAGGALWHEPRPQARSAARTIAATWCA